MTYTYKIPSDPVYVQSLGQAFYNFTYLEWVITCTIVKLSSDGFSVIPKKAVAGTLEKLLKTLINTSSPPLSASLRAELDDVHTLFKVAIDTRNHLLHAHPYTAQDGAQQLSYGSSVRWDVATIEKAAVQFEEAAIKANDVFHSSLAQARP